jgi:hypothetical protein
VTDASLAEKRNLDFESGIAHGLSILRESGNEPAWKQARGIRPINGMKDHPMR